MSESYSIAAEQEKHTKLDENIYSSESSFREALSKIETGDAKQEIPDTNIPSDVENAIADSEHSDEAEEHIELENSIEPEIEQETSKNTEKGHLIPKSRFNQEIEKRKVLEEQLVKEREERIRYETQLQMLNAMQQQAQAQATQPQQSEPELDPLDTDTYNYAKREIESLKNQLANVAKDTAERTREMQYHGLITAQEAAFEREHPDFKDAMKHVQEIEYNIAKDLLGDERAAQEYVGAKLRDALTKSLDTGKNAAQTIYNMAKTYGFNASKTQSQSTQNLPTKNVGAIARNMARSANTNGLGNNANFSNIPTDISVALNKSGNQLSGVNADTFHKMIDKLMR